MEPFAREPTSPSQNPTAPATALPRIDTVFNFIPQPYPSPIHERTLSSSAPRVTADMAVLSPNGAGSLPAAFHSESVSPRTVTVPSPPPKKMEFVLLSPYPSRLPLRVNITSNDTTDSITTTVRNFFGIYPTTTVPLGFSFEDQDGNTFIARYENFQENRTVYVRVIEHPPGPAPGYHTTNGYLPQGPQPPHTHASRPASRTSRLRSPSPNGVRGRRSASAATNPAGKKGRSRSSKNRTQVNGDGYGESFNGYSSGDGAASSAGRAKEQLGNTEISLDNIVEGGRRKVAKFESAELPLFAPPQMPASTSNPSVSPARRNDPHRNPLPSIQPGQNPFSNPQPLQSPGPYMNGYAKPGMYATPVGDNRREFGSSGPSGQGVGPVMMTPDPTVRSAMSEEDKDVALSLMIMSKTIRASASAHDDTFSGRADAASSAGATSDADSHSEDELPPARRQKLDVSESGKHMFDTAHSHVVSPKDRTEANDEKAEFSDCDENDTMAAPARKAPRLKANTLISAKARPQLSNKTKPSKAARPKTKKTASSAVPMTPASLPASRNQSVVSNGGFPLGLGQEEQPDLSSMPRCKRCCKSKKGCDRQRPCGRCRDSGKSWEECVPEDEGNGRKGRYGRHMGVPVKTDDMPLPATDLLPAAPIAVDAPMSGLAAPILSDKNKKRKR